ncbi:uncharacterized protein [Tenebrio molitor]|uniref:uncharacterized protein isoform X1 n=2 Tax=Tenebrio molitor TaxID=7067 RepID=UPI00362480D0
MCDLAGLCEQESTPTKLLKAVNNQNLEELKSLTAPDVPVHLFKYSNDDTLLHIAVRKKNVPILEHLLSLGSLDINAFNNLGKTPLLMAAIEPNSQILKALIEKDADLNLGDPDGNTPLHYAAYYNFVDNCVVLLERGANVNVQNKRGFTVLHVVCGVHTELELVAMLMFYGADVSIPSSDDNGIGYTPFELCLMHNKVTFQKFLLDYVMDEVAKTPILLGALVGAMEHRAELFPIIVQHVSEVIYDTDELRIFLNKIMYFKPEYLRLFIQHFDYIVKAIRNVDTCLMTSPSFYIEEHLTGYPRTYSNLIENLYIIFDEPLACYFVESVNKAHKPNILSTLVHICFKQKLPIKSLSHAIYHLLSYGVELTHEIVEQIYYCFGDGEMFRTLLHMDIQKTADYWSRAPLPAIIYDVAVKDVDTFLKKPNTYDRVVLEKLASFYAGCQVKEFCVSVEKDLSETVEKLPDVPLLLELARNAARNHIVQVYHVKNSRQYCTVLDFLPLCNEYKAILSFQKKLYSLT